MPFPASIAFKHVRFRKRGPQIVNVVNEAGSPPSLVTISGRR